MKDIENHKKVAIHIEEAAKHHEAGNHEKAHHSTIKDHGHREHAVEAQREVLKHHATIK